MEGGLPDGRMRAVLGAVVLLGILSATAADIDSGELWEKARDLEHKQQWEPAARTYGMIPNDARALYYAGLAWESAKRGDEARKTYLQVLERFPKSPQAAKSRFVLAILAQRRGDFAEMEEWLLGFLHDPKDTPRRADALWLLGGHYLSTRADRWAAYGCFETLRRDYPDDPEMGSVQAQWKEVSGMGDLELWSRVQVRWGRVGKVPDFLPLFLLTSKETARVKPPAK